MTRDIEERLRLYSGVEIEVVRLALNWDQVEVWRPPENPAKETDARYAKYVSEFGDSSWELDSIEPAQLAKLVEEAVLERRDEEIWGGAVGREDEMRKELLGFVEEYNKKEF